MQITTGPTLLFVPLVRCVMSRKKNTAKQNKNKVKHKYLKETKANGTIQCQEIRKFKPEANGKRMNRNNETYPNALFSRVQQRTKRIRTICWHFWQINCWLVSVDFALSRANQQWQQPSEWTNGIKPNQTKPKHKHIYKYTWYELRALAERKFILFDRLHYIVRNGIDGAYVVVRYTFVMICVFCISRCIREISIPFRCFLSFVVNTHIRTYICNRGRK